MRNTTWKTFWKIFPLLAVVPVGVLILISRWEVAALYQGLERAEFFAVDAQTEVLNRGLDEVGADVLNLAAQNELHDFLETGDRTLLPRIAHEYLALSRNARVLDQIRYLDEQGREVVRVNFNAGHPSVVLEESLQDKQGRYYFRATLALGRGRLYLSPLDLNIENGAIEIPYKPMIRVGTPVFDARGRKRGIILVNFLAQRLLADVKQAGRTSLGQPMLLNEDGYWLLSPDPPPSWGFMFPTREEVRMQSLYPQAWAAMNQAPSGASYTKNGLFVFQTVYPFSERNRLVGEARKGVEASASYRWFVLSHVPQASINQGRDRILIWAMIAGVLLLLLLAVGVRTVSLALIERRRHQERLERMAHVDALTGIANRGAFEERLEQEFERARRHDRRFALLYIDLDGFKTINDTSGHQVGDRVLRDVAASLAGGCRSEDLAGRYGGDEFAVLLSELPDIATAAMVAEKIRDRIQALDWEGRSVSASIGVALFPDHSEDLLELIRLADAAMYASKKAGKNRVTLV